MDTVELDDNDQKTYAAILKIVKQYNSLPGESYDSAEKKVLREGIEREFWGLTRGFISSSGFSVREGTVKPSLHLRDDSTIDVYCKEKVISNEPVVGYEAKFKFALADSIGVRCVLLPHQQWHNMSQCLIPELVKIVWPLRTFTEGLELNGHPPILSSTTGTGGDRGLEISPVKAVSQFLAVAESLCKKLGPERLENIRILSGKKSEMLRTIHHESDILRQRDSFAVLEKVIEQMMDKEILDIVLSV